MQMSTFRNIVNAKQSLAFFPQIVQADKVDSGQADAEMKKLSVFS